MLGWKALIAIGSGILAGVTLVYSILIRAQIKPRSSASEGTRRNHTSNEVPERDESLSPVRLRSTSKGISGAHDATQFSGTEGAEARDLVLGLDFGTSSTKVVIRSPFMYGARAVAVPADYLSETGRHGISRYLLPSRLYCSSTSIVNLSSQAGYKELIDLKLELMEGTSKIEAVTRSGAYLGLVMRHAREWFLRTQKEGYSQYRLRWSLNLGIPSAGYGDSETRRLFGAAARVAWALSCSASPISLQRARELATDAMSSEIAADLEIKLIPEVAAEVATYARSPQRTPGLHLMVDVGASTLDVCSFVLHEQEGEDLYALLTALVEKLGALMLHRHRIDRIGRERVKPEIGDLSFWDQSSVVPDDIAQYVSGMPVADLNQIDRDFADRCVGVLGISLRDLKRCRDPLSPRWQEGLPVFLCGGGSRMEFFRGIVQKAEQYFQKATNAKGLLQRALPPPRDLDLPDLPHEDFDRVAVAYGLSYDSLDIGRVEPPSASDDIPPFPIRGYGDQYISKDLV